jgi:hypothetical protein
MLGIAEPKVSRTNTNTSFLPTTAINGWSVAIKRIRSCDADQSHPHHAGTAAWHASAHVTAVALLPARRSKLSRHRCALLAREHNLAADPQQSTCADAQEMKLKGTAAHQRPILPAGRGKYKHIQPMACAPCVLCTSCPIISQPSLADQPAPAQCLIIKGSHPAAQYTQCAAPTLQRCAQCAARHLPT